MRRYQRGQQRISTLVLIGLLLFSAGPLASCSRAPTGPGENDIKVLFIGNSLTYYNDMPGMFRTLAQIAGKEVYVRESTVANSTIDFHATSSHTLNRIKLYDWDYVVLQGASFRIAFPSTVSELMPYYTLLKDYIWRYCPNARVVMFMDWAPREGIDLLSGEHLSYTEFQQMLHDGTRYVAEALGFMIAPVGWGWKHVYENSTTISMIGTDQTHPTRSGSFLQACIYYATIFQESPEGINYLGGIISTISRFMKSTAAEVVLTDPARWFLPELDTR
ncbi:DUF4886 domain-containing protein [Candidatus Zixiibacteriota bacterium]